LAALISAAARRLWPALLLACAVAWGVGGGATAQPLNAVRASAVKAAFLIKFASFVEWPANTWATPQEPLVIGVVGDDGVYSDLEQLAQGRTVNARPVVALRLRDLPPDAGRVHILFIAAGSEDRVRELVSRAAGPVLVVTQTDAGLAVGSALNFVLEGARLRFDASPGNAQARGIRLSSRLLAVARFVDGRKT
jgi:hypothetical protein